MRWNHFLPRWHRDVIKPFLSFGLRGYVANILQFFNNRLDVFIVNFFLGPAAVGIYAVSYGIAELIWNFPNAINFVLFPRIASERGQSKNNLTGQILILSVILTSIGAIILALIGQFLISLLYGNAFQEAYYPLLALLPGVILLGAAKVLTAEILGRGYPQYNSIISGLGLAVTIAGDLIMIPRFGVMGAAVSSSLSYTVILIMSVGFYLKVKPRNLATQVNNIF
jgi:O-antigen/teichoic acid export membrane protein